MKNSNLHEYIKMGIRRQHSDAKALPNGPSKEAFLALPTVQAYWADQATLQPVQDYWGKLSTPFASYAQESALIALGALTDAGEPTAEGLLYFHPEPQQWLPSAVVYCTQYGGIDRSQKLAETCIAGSLVQQYEQSLQWVAKTLQWPDTPSNPPTRESILPLVNPYRLSEGVFNALVHHHYEGESPSIQIEVFSDRIQIINTTTGRRFMRRGQWARIIKWAYNAKLYTLSFPINPRIDGDDAHLNHLYLGQAYFSRLNSSEHSEQLIDFKLTLFRPEAKKIWAERYDTPLIDLLTSEPDEQVGLNYASHAYSHLPPHLGDFFTLSPIDAIRSY